MLLEALLSRAALNASVRICHSIMDVKSVLTAEPSRFDVIFLDMMLPDGGGEEVVAAIKEHSPCAQLIVVSGMSGERLAGAASEIDFDDYFQKPLDLVRVKNRIAEICAGCRE